MDNITFSNCAASNTKIDFEIPNYGWPDTLTCNLQWAEEDTLADFQKVKACEGKLHSRSYDKLTPM